MTEIRTAEVMTLPLGSKLVQTSGRFRSGFGRPTRSHALNHITSHAEVTWEGVIGHPWERPAISARWTCGGSSRYFELVGPPEGEDPGFCRGCIDALIGPVVYYAERDGVIKVGHSSSPLVRTTQMDARLLAWEPGGFDLERQRHQELRVLGAQTSDEWFRPVPELVQRIFELRSQCASELPLDPFVVCGLGPPLLPTEVAS